MRKLATTDKGKLRTGLAAMVAITLLGGGFLTLQQDRVLAMMHGHGHNMGHAPGAGQFGHDHGADGTGHDMVNMPGLRGLDATAEESRELEIMFRNFPLITRSVSNLPDGIRTVTRSENEDLMGVLVSHVTGMIGRVEEGRDPQVFIQSPTLDILFERRDRIETEIEVTEEGIVVIQTSDDPEVVEALHTHAGEVSDMADRGMEAVHEMMMKRAQQ